MPHGRSNSTLDAPDRHYQRLRSSQELHTRVCCQQHVQLRTPLERELGRQGFQDRNHGSGAHIWLIRLDASSE